MKKIPSLFLRDFEIEDHPITPTVNPECMWVVEGQGIGTIKFDGSACLVQNSILFKRYDRRPGRKAKRRRRKHDSSEPFLLKDFKVEPPGWIPCEDEPNLITGHWFGWALVDFKKAEDKWHREAWERTLDLDGNTILENKSFEIVGPKVQGNPYDLDEHQLWPHGVDFDQYTKGLGVSIEPPRTFDGLREWFEAWDAIEGIVWWHPDGRKAKVKRTDWGLPWPT